MARRYRVHRVLFHPNRHYRQYLGHFRGSGDGPVRLDANRHHHVPHHPAAGGRRVCADSRQADGEVQPALDPRGGFGGLRPDVVGERLRHRAVAVEPLWRGVRRDVGVLHVPGGSGADQRLVQEERRPGHQHHGGDAVHLGGRCQPHRPGADQPVRLADGCLLYTSMRAIPPCSLVPCPRPRRRTAPGPARCPARCRRAGARRRREASADAPRR